MSLDKSIAQCLYKDRIAFQKKLKEILAITNLEQREHVLSKLRARIDHSRSIRSDKLQQIPKISYPDLPIVQAKANIIQAIQENQVVIVAAETGSGKSTQIPKFCLELQRGIDGYIGHTQPRRLAARSIADRIAQELDQPLGKSVGFAVRFQDIVNPTTHIKVMTDGILLNEIQYDKQLLHYDTLIIDEAHERSLNIDLLLGYLRHLLDKGSHLKIIITSATIAIDTFSKFFHDAPIIEVPGKLYPVATYYRSKEQQEDYFSHLKRVVEEALQQGSGDILVFLTGEGEIHEAQKLLKLQNYRNTEILPLYAKLNLEAQRKIFKTGPNRRILLSTNVAETSLTVPNVRFVIDMGFARISRYNYRSKIQRLPIEPISQASSKQRQGRAGRLSSGICYRLYEESDFLARPLFTEPEIQRSNLAAVLLKMGQLQLGNLQNFPLIDPPEKSLVQDGLKQLERLEALVGNELTPLGRQMAKIPLDPKSSRILIKASQLNALSEILIILSGLSIQDPREYPKEYLAKATSLHSQFNHPKSQFLTLLTLWHHLHEVKKLHSQKQLRLYLHKNFLSYVRFLEWQDIHHQLTTECKKMRLPLNEKDATYEEIHKALLSGFFENIGIFDEEKKCYLGVRGVQFMVPKQALPIRPKWIMAAQFIETHRVYASCVAELNPTWVMQVVPHLCKSHPGEMFWDPKSGFVKNHESVSFFGLTIIARRAVIAKTHESAMQDIFLREALIENVLQEFAFLVHNHQRMRELKELEQRIRRLDYLIDYEKLFAFYKSKLPPHVHSLVALRAWLRTHGEETLKISKEAIASFPDLSWIENAYWSDYPIDGLRFKLSYLFDPLEEEDGISLEIGLQHLALVQHHDFSWGVPGQLSEKIEAILLRLPKNYRLQLPTLKQCLQDIPAFLDKKSTFLDALKDAILQAYKVNIPNTILVNLEIPDYLSFYFKITDNGKVIARGRNFKEILTRFRDSLPESASAYVQETKWISWEIQKLPYVTKKKIEDKDITLFVALVDKKTYVNVEYFSDENLSLQEHAKGLTRLYLLSTPKIIQSLFKDKKTQSVKKLAAILLKDNTWIEDAIALTYALCFTDSTIRTKEQFESNLKTHQAKIYPRYIAILNVLEEIVQKSIALQQKITRARKEKGLNFRDSLQDIDQQFTALLHRDFLKNTAYEWVQRYPIYLQAIDIRLDKLLSNPIQDQTRLKELQPIVEAFQKICGDQCSIDCITLRWFIEEYRISLFAQPLKTKMPISKKKLLEWLKLLR